MLTVGSLFAGIGGLELGLEAALGCTTLWQVEIEDYPRRVLDQHWPHADRRVSDVRLAHRTYATPGGVTFTAGALPRVDLVCGGFPCQDLSVAGKGAGLEGAKSGLWFQYLRLLRELRPRFVVLENVPALVVRGLDVVLGGLAALGYDAEWSVFGASDVGAPHRRERVFIVACLADADGEGQLQPSELRGEERRRPGRRCGALAHAKSVGLSTLDSLRKRGPQEVAEPGAVGRRCAGCRHTAEAWGQLGRMGWRKVPDPDSERRCPWARCGGPAGSESDQRRTEGEDGHRESTPQPRLGVLADGLPGWLDEPCPRTARDVSDLGAKLKALGNAVVPRCGYVAGMRVRELLQ